MPYRLPRLMVMIYLSTLIGAGWTRPAYAQSITENQRLDFGTWFLAGNPASYSITINADGSYSSSPELIMLSPPQEGFYLVTGLPSFANILSVSVVMTQPITGPGSQVFTMDNFDVIAPDADAVGDTTITLGARAVTSGNGVNYGNGVYNGELTLEINL